MRQDAENDARDPRMELWRQGVVKEFLRAQRKWSLAVRWIRRL